MSRAGVYRALPIFPLPAVQLFPHALLPLHVFEPRYRALLEDCLTSGGRMAIATLEPGFEPDYEGRPPVRKLCGVGEIVAHEELENGRANIVLRGLTRARIVEEMPPERAYRIVRAEPLHDIYPPQLNRREAQDTLVALADQLAARLPTGGATLRELVRSQSQLGELCDLLAAAVVVGPDQRQMLLETLDVAARAEVVGYALVTALSSAEGNGGQRN
jgi:Lon protease-like protein